MDRHRFPTDRALNDSVLIFDECSSALRAMGELLGSFEMFLGAVVSEFSPTSDTQRLVRVPAASASTGTEVFTIGPAGSDEPSLTSEQQRHLFDARGDVFRGSSDRLIR